MVGHAPRLSFAPAPDMHGALLERANWAAREYSRYDRGTTLSIADRVARAAFESAQHYAELAVRETGFGVIAHKKLKNELCSRGVFETYRDSDYSGPIIDAERKIVRIARPAGVVLALTPSTNPVATVFFKTILALLTRNAVVICPHPAAKKCCAEAADMLAAAARDAGAPDGVIQVVREPTIPLLENLMRDDRVSLIVATGGPAVVRAAYKSGRPALGVGSGNGAAYVHDSADPTPAARKIVESKSFDNSVLCTSESVVLAEDKIANRLLEQFKLAGAHVCSVAERDKLRSFLWKNDGFNVAAIGRDASVIAESAGFSVSRDARILVVPIDSMLPEEAFIGEKLCPVLAFARVHGVGEAITGVRAMMRKSGRGHSAAVHANDEIAIMRFSAAAPVLRVVVNAPCSQGAAGFGTSLGPTMTIGTGFVGGSALGENLTPASLINWTSIAYPKEDTAPFGSFEGIEPWISKRTASVSLLSPPVQTRDSTTELRDEIRRMVRDELAAILERR